MKRKSQEDLPSQQQVQQETGAQNPTQVNKRQKISDGLENIINTLKKEGTELEHIDNVFKILQDSFFSEENLHFLYRKDFLKFGIFFSNNHILNF